MEISISASILLKIHFVEVNEQKYELITKELLSEISEEEKQLLDDELAASIELRRKKEILHNFWINIAHPFGAGNIFNGVVRVSRNFKYPSASVQRPRSAAGRAGARLASAKRVTERTAWLVC